MRALLVIFLAAISFSCRTEKEYLVKFETKYGDMYAVLFDETPKHKENFVNLAQAGRFDSTDFHRVIKDFMIQGGDVFGKEGLPQEDWYTVPAEIKPGFIHEKGMIAAARMGNNVNPERRSSGSQFYIVQGKVYDRNELLVDMKLLSESFFKYMQLASNRELMEEYQRLYQSQEFETINQMMLATKSDLEAFYNINLEKNMTQQQIDSYTTVGGTPHLDNEYTVFGKLIQGLDVMEKIAEVETGPRDKPIDPVYMKVSVSQVSKSKITKDFGYEFGK
ncbi:peptidylprolyl isomerase [Mongoliitalea daihaiensis]|uniref:peptidylprolyl isomerase n=1 Tax=Mongoliitalea daihaiensis TaxID=2782006 RepID=UPI001F3C5B81|nr:peptidylprolyl isomerase [Mongoliitalea daihaiensis]UJP65252.1 peptidylprolyl isomerase [Mongoliitalea daihaiensis]